MKAKVQKSKKGSLFDQVQIVAANNAYVPDATQHWTFERLNDRYKRDAMALQKAMNSPVAQGAGSSSSSSSSTPLADRVLAGFTLSEKRTKTPDSDLKGPVVIINMTNLPQSLGEKMVAIRDQVSFILSQHRRIRGQNDVKCELESILTGLKAEDAPQRSKWADPDGRGPNSVNNSTETNNTSTHRTEPGGKEDEEVFTTEVVVLLESSGGYVADYGLAAEELARLRNEPGLRLTICVDRVAASGGYMMAVTAHQLLVAPFAVVGSVGVVTQAINIQRTLEGYGVRPIVLSAGKNKVPLSAVGDVTREGIANVQSNINAIHTAFKAHVVKYRPVLNDSINKVATGDIWLGVDALPLDLVDGIMTSDEYIDQKLQSGVQVLRLIPHQPRFLFGSNRHASRASFVSSSISAVSIGRQLSGWVRSVLHDVLVSLAGGPTGGIDGVSESIPGAVPLAATAAATSIQTKANGFPIPTMATSTAGPTP